MHTQVISGNRGTWIFEKEHHAVTVFVPSESPTKEECSQLADHISGQTAIPFRLVLFPISSWDRDLTPWPAAPVFKNQHLDGLASQTLSQLMNEYVPAYSDPANLIAGYSLAGLFSLWAMTQTQVFQGAASCSGSLWYPGFTDYMRSAQLPASSLIYLSLGDLEEKTRHPVLRTIGQETRGISELLSARSDVLWTTLEMNPGNHFAEPDHRLARGIACLIEHLPLLQKT